MNNSFLILNRKLITDNYYRNKIGNDGLITYMLLGDRMKVSMANHWIDSRNGQFFIYYTIDQLKKAVRIGRTKMCKILKTFKKLGLISTLRNPNGRCNRIFLPKFVWRMHRSSDSERVYSNNKFNNNKSICKTSHTSTRAQAHDDASTNKTQQLKQIKLEKRHDKLDNDEVNNLAQDTYQKMRLPKQIIDTINIYSFNKPKVYYHYISLLIRAKKSVRNDFRHTKGVSVFDFKLACMALTFEINDYYKIKSHSLARHVRKIIVTAKRGIKHIRHADRYIMASFKNMFHGIAENYITNYKMDHGIEPRIPIFKI